MSRNNRIGLDTNLKRNIQNRSDNDLTFIRSESEDIIQNEDDNDYEEVNEDNNKEILKEEDIKNEIINK